ncbi:AcrR family transcriptional regulator [Wenyingzhuangia heitensis]|uniref:AcrR family transcriptional regulator n=1 Tax=Wenyingzhuangia heitensis TaxID=1487859 RepID=A0ABX0UB59_9FLAO|nr:TetR/AcrR family transcriptional regulator [Wenyingzhuangia heitensis]NIJ46057.1 AcrR family transcriptional regulator [Wenyingzhuangia heitensis]
MNTTKQKILKTSLDLFNQQGLYKVTLRRIAKEINISQGNLNYHYKKREDIIETLYFSLVADIDKTMLNINQNQINVKTLHQLSSAVLHLFYEYRFFLLDFTQIMREQPVVKTHYNQLVKIRKQQTLDLFNTLVANKLMRNEQFKNEFDDLYTRIQILSDFWMSSITIENTLIDKKTTDKYVKIITESIYPYLTKKGLDEYYLLLT